MKNETIILANTLDTELKDLPKRVPKDAARYHFFLYKHTHEGDYLESISMRKFLNMKLHWLVSNSLGILSQRERCVSMIINFSHLVVKLWTCEGEILCELSLLIMSAHKCENIQILAILLSPVWN